MSHRGAFFALFAVLAASVSHAAPANGLESVSIQPDHQILWGVVHSSDGARSVLHRSTNQGVTWQPVRYQPDIAKNPAIYRVTAHPTRNGTAFLTTTQAGGYLWRTTDGGATWTNPGAGFQGVGNLIPATVKILIQPEPSRVVYAALGDRLFRSLDDGETFDAGVPLPCRNIENSLVDASRLVCHNTATLVYSTDGGRSWNNGAAPGGDLTDCVLISSPQAAETYMGYCLAVEVTQKDRWFRSTNTLRDITPFAGPVEIPFNFETGIQIRFSPNRGVIFTVGTGGMRKSLDLGQTWQPVNNTMSSVAGFAFHPNDPSVIYNNGTQRSVNGGTAFSSLNSKRTPLFPITMPLRFDLPVGGIWHDAIVLRDALGVLYSLEPELTAQPANAPWLTFSPQNNTTTVSAAGLAQGSYQTTLTAGPNSIPLTLNVIAAPTPATNFTLTRLSGNVLGGAIEPFGPGAMPGEGGPAVNAPLAAVTGVTADPSGNIYFSYFQRVQKISADGSLTRYAGTGAFVSHPNNGDGGPAIDAGFGSIGDILWTADGLLIYERSQGSVRRVRNDLTIETQVPPNDKLKFGLGLRADASGTPHLATRTAVYRIQGSNALEIFTAASLGLSVHGIPPVLVAFAIDPRNNDFILALDDRIVRRTQAGVVSTIAGTAGQLGFAGDGAASANGSLIISPFTMTVDSAGNIYFSDSQRLRTIRSTGVIGTAGGTGADQAAYTDGAAAASTPLGYTYGLTMTPAGALLHAGGSYLTRFDAAPASGRRIFPGGIVSITGRSPVSPGQVISIYGEDLATSSLSAQNVPLPTSLDGMSVEINGIPAPLFYVSPGLINLQMPYEIASGTAVVKVIRNGQATPEETVQVAETTPDILVYNGTRAVAVNIPSRQVNGPSAPAPPGLSIEIYLSGAGPFSTPPATGAPAGFSPLSAAQKPASVTLTPASGQNTAPVTITPDFLGLTPSGVGLVQCNIKIPDNLPPGEYDLTLTVGGVVSNVTRITVGS